MLGWIQELIGSFFDKLRTLGAGIVGRIMATLGISWATINYAATDFIGFLQSHAGGAGGDVVAVLAYIRIPEAMSMIVSAYVTHLAGKVFLAPLRALVGLGSPGAGQ